MTVTPSASTPVIPGVPGATPGTDVSETAVAASGLFAQLMAALAPQIAPATPAPGEQPTGEPASDGPVATTPVLAPPSAGPAHVPTGPLTMPVPGGGTTPTGGTAATADISVVAGPPTGAAPRPTTPPTGVATAADTGVALSSPVSALTTPTTPSTSPAATTALSAVAPTRAPLPAPMAHGPKTGAEPVTPEAAAGPMSGLPSSLAPTGVPTTTSDQAAATAASAPPSVSRQVIPELTRMSTLGEGVHRLTMTLRPESLGEVRVTMTVRDGSLHVRLAAGTEAQHALVPDLTELQQVLKLGSGSDVRVVLRDLTGTPTTPDHQSAQTGAQTGAQAGGQQGTGQHAGHGTPTGQDPGTTAGSGQHSRREAGTPRDINATDGAVDGTSGSRSQAVRRVRPTGVDLTM